MLHILTNYFYHQNEDTAHTNNGMFSQVYLFNINLCDFLTSHYNTESQHNFTTKVRPEHILSYHAIDPLHACDIFRITVEPLCRTPSGPRKYVRYKEVPAKKWFSMRFLINPFPEKVPFSGGVEDVRYKEVLLYSRNVNGTVIAFLSAVFLSYHSNRCHIGENITLIAHNYLRCICMQGFIL